MTSQTGVGWSRGWLLQLLTHQPLPPDFPLTELIAENPISDFRIKAPTMAMPQRHRPPKNTHYEMSMRSWCLFYSAYRIFDQEYLVILTHRSLLLIIMRPHGLYGWRKDVVMSAANKNHRNKSDCVIIVFFHMYTSVRNKILSLIQHVLRLSYTRHAVP
jgi:hypothetical protein